MKKKYTIWFEQVNKTKYEVKAETPLKALEEARAEWRADNLCPTWYMEDENGNEIK